MEERQTIIHHEVNLFTGEHKVWEVTPEEARKLYLKNEGLIAEDEEEAGDDR